MLTKLAWKRKAQRAHEDDWHRGLRRGRGMMDRAVARLAADGLLRRGFCRLDAAMPAAAAGMAARLGMAANGERRGLAVANGSGLVGVTMSSRKKGARRALEAGARWALAAEARTAPAADIASRRRGEDWDWQRWKAADAA